MFSSGQMVFAIFFVVAFTIVITYMYRKDLKFLKNTYKGEQKELFEDWFVYQALDKLVPVEKNEFINFKDKGFLFFGLFSFII